jgi:hypothetical protein
MSFTNAKIIGSNVSYAEYRSDKQRGDKSYPMSRGELCKFLECPAKWVEGGAPEKKNESMEWGSLIDTLVLTPDEFAKRYVVAPVSYPDSKTGELKPWNWNATYCKQWREQHDGATVIKHADAEFAQQAKSRLFRDPEIRELIECSDKQVMVQATYQDAETSIDVPVRILIDLLPPESHAMFGKSVVDLKTIASAQPKEYRRAVFTFGWHVQAALYIDILNATGQDRCDFRHIVQESEPPFITAKRLLSQEFLALGRATYRTALAAYCQCLATKTWQDYDAYARELYQGWRMSDVEAWMLTAQTDWPVERIVEA